MASGREQLKQALHKELPVYYIASTEQGMLFEAGRYARNVLTADGQDATTIMGPVPDLGEVIAAAGVISFFGTRRIVELREISPSTMKDKDVEALVELFSELENASLLITSLYKDKKTASGKKAKLLLKEAEKQGFAWEISKPTLRENISYVNKSAKELGAVFAPGGAEALVERAGDDRILLKNEVAKLAAMSGYGAISVDLVERYGAHNIEADVFSLLRLITSGQKMQTFEKLGDLFSLRHEPVAVTAALAGSYVDMLRVRLGEKSGRNIGQIMQDMGYKGSEWRLKKARENAARYSTQDLEKAVFILSELDRALKSSAVSDKETLVQAAVGELLLLGGR